MKMNNSSDRGTCSVKLENLGSSTSCNCHLFYLMCLLYLFHIFFGRCRSSSINNFQVIFLWHVIDFKPQILLLYSSESVRKFLKSIKRLLSFWYPIDKLLNTVRDHRNSFSYNIIPLTYNIIIVSDFEFALSNKTAKSLRYTTAFIRLLWRRPEIENVPQPSWRPSQTSKTLAALCHTIRDVIQHPV